MLKVLFSRCRLLPTTLHFVYKDSLSYAGFGGILEVVLTLVSLPPNFPLPPSDGTEKPEGPWTLSGHLLGRTPGLKSSSRVGSVTKTPVDVSTS